MLLQISTFLQRAMKKLKEKPPNRFSKATFKKEMMQSVNMLTTWTFGREAIAKMLKNVRKRQ